MHATSIHSPPNYADNVRQHLQVAGIKVVVVVVAAVAVVVLVEFPSCAHLLGCEVEEVVA